MTSSYDGLEPDLDEIRKGIEETQLENDAFDKQSADEATRIDNYNATQKDPRLADQWGIKGVAKELQSSLSGGLQDTASSVTTFAERTVDAFSGEM